MDEKVKVSTICKKAGIDLKNIGWLVQSDLEALFCRFLCYSFKNGGQGRRGNSVTRFADGS